MGRKISYYGQKSMVLWAEKYDIMGRKRAERSLGGCSSPLSLTPVNSISPPPIPVQQRLPADQLQSLFSLLKIGNPSLFLSPSFPLSVHQISRDRRHSFASLTFQHTLIHCGGRLLLSIETFTLPPLQLLNLLEGIWSDRRGGRTLDAHSSLPFCGLHSRANLANRFREHLSLFHIL